MLTCNSCLAFGLDCRLWERPLPPDGRHFSGVLGCVGDAGAVLSLFSLTVSQPVTLWRADSSVLQLRGLLVRSSSAVCGDFLPLKPAWKRCVSLEVEVPAAAVLLSDFLQLYLQVTAQLVVVHRAKQTPAHRLFTPDGIHPSNGPG